MERGIHMLFISGLGSDKNFMLQLFANFEDVVSQNEKAFEGLDFKGQFAGLSTKLSELGYDVLINNKKAAEFVPSSRLSDVVSQRDSFKGQADGLNKQLLAMQASAKGNEALEAQIQTLMDSNANLLKDNEAAKMNAEITSAAKDAINPKDMLMFIDLSNIKINAKGEIIGVEAEIAKLRAERPYLFSADGVNANVGKRRKAGTDPNGDKGSGQNFGDMNSSIRRASGRL